MAFKPQDGSQSDQGTTKVTPPFLSTQPLPHILVTSYTLLRARLCVYPNIALVRVALVNRKHAHLNYITLGVDVGSHRISVIT